VTVERLHERARAELPAEIYDFFAGAADDEVTLADNAAAWRGVRLQPRALADAGAVDTSVDLLGQRLPHPVALAPIAYQGLLHPEAEAATARGAATAGALYVVSTRSTVPLEDVAAAAPDGPRWFQVYVLRDRGLTAELARRAAASRYRALVLTGDTPLLGRKRRDERNGFVIPEEHARGNLTGLRHAPESMQDPAVSFADVGWLHEQSGLPVLVKGVLRGDDALLCLEAGAAGVIVSNHGGRQLDGAISTVRALPEVVDAVAGRAPVLVDGGIGSGTDVVRALALGADAVLVGRAAAWAVASAGADGVAGMVAELVDELASALASTGCRSVRECGRHVLAAQAQ
jgi:4-hydroxymandelate oxidase